MTAKSAPAANVESVVVSTTIAATPAVVWSFLSDAERFRTWIGAFAGVQPLPGTRVDPRIGGKLRVEYQGGTFAAGEIIAIEPEKRIELTWGYEGGGQGMLPGSTRVEILLSPTAGGTRVELRHHDIPTQEAREGHRGGWTHYLSMFARDAAAAQHAVTLGEVCATYFQAWNERDDQARSKLLVKCCESDVRVRTSFANTNTIPELNGHIANGLKHMPGMSLKPMGTPQQLHGFARFDWTVDGPDGRSYFRGVNFAELSLSGRLRTLVGFPELPAKGGNQT
jgi:uncharacterized protein YndB with AHSA1/START domain